MWGIQEFNIDTTANLVSLRADWHAAFDGGCWAFVPTQSVLDKILRAVNNATFKKPYPKYQAPTKYIFVPLPTLGRKIITRANFGIDAFTAHFLLGDGQFSGFPILKHHAHPYFVIANALPKLQAHVKSLGSDQRKLLKTMVSIEKSWLAKLTTKKDKSQLPGQKRRRDESDEGSHDEGDGDSPKSRGKQSRSRKVLKRGSSKRGDDNAGKGKGKGKQQEAGDTTMPSLYPTPSNSAFNITKKGLDRYAYRANVSLWIDDVVTCADPLEKADGTVVKSDDEAPRAPFRGDWHNWCCPWTRPSDRSKFSSNDWAIQERLSFLTREPLHWDLSESDEDISDDDSS